MPMMKMLKMMHISVGLLALTVAMQFFVIVSLLRVAPADVLNEVRAVKSEMVISNQTTREAITVNEAEIARLKKDMRDRTLELQQAVTQLKKLDPNYVAPIIPEIE